MTPWTVAHRLLCPWGFSRQLYWSGLPCPPPGNLPNPGIEPRSPALQVDSLPSKSPVKPFLSLDFFFLKQRFSKRGVQEGNAPTAFACIIQLPVFLLLFRDWKTAEARLAGALPPLGCWQEGAWPWALVQGSGASGTGGQQEVSRAVWRT